jgi:hypothetical protein
LVLRHLLSLLICLQGILYVVVVSITGKVLFCWLARGVRPQVRLIVPHDQHDGSHCPVLLKGVHDDTCIVHDCEKKKNSA